MTKLPTMLSCLLLVLAHGIPSVVPRAEQSERQRPQEQQQQEQRQQKRQTEEPEQVEPRPDLRIVGFSVDPEPLRHGRSATLTVLVHNDSTVAAAGGIGVEVVHDRLTPLPLPIRQEFLYLGPDGLIEVEFQVHDVVLYRTPYTFFAVVDVGGAVDETDETDNVFWERFDVCGAPRLPEVPDGFDNDCNGLVDDGIGLPPDTATAVRMLRQMQRQAELDRVPVVFALARVFAPFAEEIPVRISSRASTWFGNVAGATPTFRSALSESDPDALLTLVDWDGGELRSGDLVSLRNPDDTWAVANGGGGGMLDSRFAYREVERQFKIVRTDEEVEEADLTPDERLARRRDPDSRPPEIRSGDAFSLLASNGRFVAAEGGGGRELRADREIAGGWETFRLVIEEREQ